MDDPQRVDGRENSVAVGVVIIVRRLLIDVRWQRSRTDGDQPVDHVQDVVIVRDPVIIDVHRQPRILPGRHQGARLKHSRRAQQLPALEQLEGQPPAT